MAYFSQTLQLFVIGTKEQPRQAATVYVCKVT